MCIHGSVCLLSAVLSWRSVFFRDKAPGQRECDFSIDGINRCIRDIEQASLAAVSQSLATRDDISVEVRSRTEECRFSIWVFGAECSVQFTTSEKYSYWNLSRQNPIPAKVCHFWKDTRITRQKQGRKQVFLSSTRILLWLPVLTWLMDMYCFSGALPHGRWYVSETIIGSLLM